MLSPVGRTVWLAGDNALTLGSLVLILMPAPVHIRLHPAHSCLPDEFAEPR